MGSPTSNISMKSSCLCVFSLLRIFLSISYLLSSFFLSSCNNTRACVRYFSSLAVCVCVCVCVVSQTKNFLCLVFDIFFFLFFKKMICCVCVCVCGVCCIDNVIISSFFLSYTLSLSSFFWYVYMI